MTGARITAFSRSICSLNVHFTGFWLHQSSHVININHKVVAMTSYWRNEEISVQVFNPKIRHLRQKIVSQRSGSYQFPDPIMQTFFAGILAPVAPVVRLGLRHCAAVSPPPIKISSYALKMSAAPPAELREQRQTDRLHTPPTPRSMRRSAHTRMCSLVVKYRVKGQEDTCHTSSSTNGGMRLPVTTFLGTVYIEDT